jgi:LemA protein
MVKRRKKMIIQTTLTVFVVIIVISSTYILATYNKFITLKNRVKEAWSDIEVQMKRRYDLIPNIVETVKGYASYEKNTLDAVVKARNTAMARSGSITDKAKTEDTLSGTLKSLFALSEHYPALKANENFLELQRELIDTENKIQASRRFYNSNVIAMNTKLEIFPSNIIGTAFGFEKQNFFKLNHNEQGAKEAVKIVF